MASSSKIIAFCLCLISTMTLCVESQHRHGDELATLLAAGLVTALLKKGARGRNTSARQVSNIILQPHRGMRLEDLVHARGLQNMEFHGFGLPPAFGGMRYNMGGLDTIPLSSLGLKALNGQALGMDFGQFPPLPHMMQNNDQAQLRNSFDFVHNIISHERSNQPPAEEDQTFNGPTLNGPTLNGPTVNMDNRNSYNYHQDDRSHVQNQQPSTSQPYNP